MTLGRRKEPERRSSSTPCGCCSTSSLFSPRPERSCSEGKKEENRVIIQIHDLILLAAPFKPHQLPLRTEAAVLA